jgi:protein phosphatase 1 regulatory subunit 37
MNGESTVLHSGRGQGKGVWGMIEESKLAKMIRLDEEKLVRARPPPTPPLFFDPDAVQINSDIVLQARSCVQDLQRVGGGEAAAVERAKGVLDELASLIEGTVDPGRMEELLGVNDELTEALARVGSATATAAVKAVAPDSVPSGGGKPKLRLEGLGLRWTEGGEVVGNGSAEGEEEEEVVTPRMDKGKARAEPEPEVQEKILSPNFLIQEEEEEEGSLDGDGEEGEVLPPSDRWVIELLDEDMGLTDDDDDDDADRGCWSRKRPRCLGKERIYSRQSTSRGITPGRTCAKRYVFPDTNLALLPG